MNIIRRSGVVVASGLIITGAMGVATPASAAPLVTGGLVNVTVTDVLNDNTVTVLDNANISVAAAVKLAAQICGTSIGVIGQSSATGTCTNTITGDTFQIDQRR